MTKKFKNVPHMVENTIIGLKREHSGSQDYGGRVPSLHSHTLQPLYD